MLGGRGGGEVVTPTCVRGTKWDSIIACPLQKDGVRKRTPGGVVGGGGVPADQDESEGGHCRT